MNGDMERSIDCSLNAESIVKQLTKRNDPLGCEYGLPPRLYNAI